VYIQHLSLTNFRNYARLELDLPRQPILLHGANAQGKTTLLEAIYYLATGRSPHTHMDRQLISRLVEDDPLAYARLAAEVRAPARDAGRAVRLDVTLRPVRLNGYQKLKVSGTLTERLAKSVRINGVPRRNLDLLGQLNVVLFLPHDVDLVAGAPAGRRRYLDVALCQADADYTRRLARYDKVVTQRNALLKTLQERGRADAGQLEFWDEELVENGAHIVLARATAVKELQQHAEPIHHELSGGLEHLQLIYHPSLEPAEAPSAQLALGLALPPDLTRRDVAALRADFGERLRRLRREELARGMTLIGPHRDELRFVASGADLGVYGSRGQQRTAVLALKLAEVRWMQARTGERPVILLDEVLAELDTARRAQVLAAVSSAEQSLLTSTDPSLFSADFLRQAHMLRVEAGQIS
jgi:DNA replication and repair protein RecF